MRFVLGALIAGLLAGCGIQSTGVVDAGEPAEGVAVGGNVYLVGTADQVEAVPRTGLGGGDVEAAVVSLLAGPEDVERAAGFRSALPDGVTLLSLRRTDNGAALTLSVDPAEFSELALTQLSCTVTAFPAAKLAEAPLVVLDGAGGTPVLAPDCPLL